MKNKILKNKELIKKLKSYSLAAGAVLAVGATTNAQVVYNNLAAPFSNGNPVDIDLNGDGAPEFQIVADSFSSTYSSYYGWWYVFQGTYALANFGSGATSQGILRGSTLPGGAQGNFPAALPENFAISSGAGSFGSNRLLAYTGGWYSAYGGSGAYPSYGNFAQYFGQERFLGLKYTDISKAPGDIHYAWLRLNQTNYASGQAVDNAYNSTPNGGVKAGSTATPAPAVPISPWAAGLAGGLIALFGLLKARKFV